MSDIKFDVRVYPIEKPKGSTKAFASVSVEDLIAIRGIRVVDGKKGLFVTMPQSKDKDGGFHDIAFPLNGDLRKEISNAILEGYGKNMEKTIAKKQSLTENLRIGAVKAAEQAASAKSASKFRGVEVG